MSRYARQIAVPGIGDEGQRRISSLSVEVRGDGLAAEICALYLAGAGVAQLVVHPSLQDAVDAINSSRRSTVDSRQLIVVSPEGDDPVLAGSEAARFVLASALRGTP
jgi:hypothetical protein